MDPTPPTLLIVEDAAEIRMLLSAGLTKAGYRTLSATQGAEGVDLFVQEKPDLILMDVSMPVMDGFEACRRIRQTESGKNIPLLMLTGSDDLHSIQQAFDSGATDFITKPINLPLLQQRIRYALRDAQREKELHQAKSLQDSASSLAGLAFWEYDPASQKLSWSGKAQQTLHWLESLPDNLETTLQMVHPDERHRLQSAFMTAMETGQQFSVEVRLLWQQKEYQLKILGQLNQPGHLLTGAVQDLTALRRLESQASYLSHHDVLTGLPNRNLFICSLADQLQAKQSFQALTLVLVLEIQRLHHIMDVFGVDATDELINRVASAFKACFKSTEGQVARLETHRFAAWITLEAQNETTLIRYLEERLMPLNRCWLLEGKEVLLNFSVGLSYAPTQGDQATQLLRYAQRALQTSKSTRHTLTVSPYHPDQDTNLQQRLTLESELRRAVETQAFSLAYQPQYNLATGRIVGVEALVRWQHPSEGFVSPATFIPILEDMGLIQTLGQWILQEACRQQFAWKQTGLRLRMGINLSPAQFEQGNLYEQILDAQQQAHASPEDIKLEITESLAMKDPDESIHLLHKLREAGFKIAIDDFGIGFSSLEYLLRFPLDSLKIDRAFVQNITQGRSDRAIVLALTSLCQGLGLSTIAEGVENLRQSDYLDALGVTELQGYLISKPLAADDLPAFVTVFEQRGIDNANPFPG